MFHFIKYLFYEFSLIKVFYKFSEKSSLKSQNQKFGIHSRDEIFFYRRQLTPLASATGYIYRLSISIVERLFFL